MLNSALQHGWKSLELVAAMKKETLPQENAILIFFLAYSNDMRNAGV
jgi:hypothetical protein